MEEEWFEEETYFDFNRDIYLIPIDRVHITKRIRKDMKSYTDIEQSKKLAEILPIESADLYYYKYGLPHFIEGQGDYESIKTDKYHDYVPCWSLAALLNVLPSSTLDSSDNHRYRFRCMERYTEWYDNAIDACVVMIERLHELKEIWEDMQADFWVEMQKSQTYKD